MKRSLLTAAAMLLMVATAAHGKSTILHRSGGWTAFHVDVGSEGNPLCGMMVTSRDNARNLMIKYQSDGGVFLQALKSSWRFKPDINVNVWVRFDNDAPLEAVGRTELTQGGQPMLAVNVKAGKEAAFLREVAESKKFYIGFPDGDEEPWVADMTGSRATALAMIRCAAYIDGKGAPTQPTGKPAPTQPYGRPEATQPQGIQPYGDAVPTPPRSKPAISKRDDGSI
jgi:hypothetical protein